MGKQKVFESPEKSKKALRKHVEHCRKNRKIKFLQIILKTDLTFYKTISVIQIIQYSLVHPDVFLMTNPALHLPSLLHPFLWQQVFFWNLHLFPSLLTQLFLQASLSRLEVEVLESTWLKNPSCFLMATTQARRSERMAMTFMFELDLN